MNDTKFDDLARRLLEGLPPAVRGLGADLETQFRAVLRANLARLDLVARDEFDAQTKVLARTRALIEQLERRVAALEASAPPAADEPATPR
jgi:ubiquinone biosynthesis accessory factor UbiK